MNRRVPVDDALSAHLDCPPLDDPRFGGQAAPARDRDAPPALRLVSASSLGAHPPPRQFLVPDLIPSRNVTLLSGDGGTGKSLLALMLCASVASGARWLGLTVSRGVAVYVSAEDELEEVHRRLAAICDAEGLDLADLDALSIVPLAGESAIMAAPRGAGGLAPMPLWKAFATKITALAPALVVLDTAADVFGGNEISRAEVRQFIGMLRGLAIKADCAILLLSHPSVAGMNSGTGISGSTAWNNSVRSRLYLTRPSAKDDSAFVDPDLRTLTTMKANYGRTGGELSLRWISGRFINETPHVTSGFDRIAADAWTEHVFLDLLAIFLAQDRDVSPNLSNSYAPAIFAKHPDARGVSKKEFAAAMERLLKACRVEVETCGPPSRRYKRLVAIKPKADP